MLTQTFYNVGVLVYWVGNHAYIATTLCENLDKPELKCDGKCYLKKNLSAGDEGPKQSKVPAPNLKKGAEVAACIFEKTLQPRIEFRPELSVLIPSEPELVQLVRAQDIFHPPG